MLIVKPRFTEVIRPPFFFFFGGLTYYSLRSVSKISSAGRLGCAVFAGILGSIVKRTSYIPTIMKN